MSYQLYRNTTLGHTLQEALDELMQMQMLSPNLALRVLLQVMLSYITWCPVLTEQSIFTCTYFHFLSWKCQKNVFTLKKFGFFSFLLFTFFRLEAIFEQRNTPRLAGYKCWWNYLLFSLINPSIVLCLTEFVKRWISRLRSWTHIVFATTCGLLCSITLSSVIYLNWPVLIESKLLLATPRTLKLRLYQPDPKTIKTN